MAEITYVLCGLTSIACAVLLLRGYVTTRMPLLFWAALCFVGLTSITRYYSWTWFCCRTLISLCCARQRHWREWLYSCTE